MKSARREGTEGVSSSLVLHSGILFAAFLLGLVLVSPELVHAQTTSGTTITIKTPSLTFTVDDAPGTTQFVELDVSAPFVGKNVGVKNLGPIWTKDLNEWTHRRAIVTVNPPARISHGFVSIPLIPPSTFRQPVTVPMRIPIRRKDMGNTAGTGSVRIAIYFHQISPAIFDIPVTLAQLPTAPINPSLTTSNDLSNYPGLFIKDGSFNGIFVLSDQGMPGDEQLSLDKIKKSLETITGNPIPADRIKKANQVTSLAQHMIVIGGPCGNSMALRLRGNPEDCAAGFRPGEGVLQLFSNGGFSQIEVSGYSQEDMFAAADALANAQTKPLQGTRHIVTKPTPPTLTNGLVGYFPFDTDMTDTISGTVGKTKKVNLIQGVYGKAAAFQSPNFLELGKYLPLRQTQGLTFAFWSLTPSYGWGGVVLETSSSESTDLDQTIYLHSPFTSFVWRPQQPLPQLSTSPIILESAYTHVKWDEVRTVNTWTHYAFTLDYLGQKASIYKNGVPQPIRFQPSPPIIWTPVPPNPNLGKTYLGGRRGAQTIGALDEVRIYNRALAESEIITLSAAPPGASLTIIPATCPTGFGDCDYNPSNGCESILNTVSNCKKCGASCEPGLGNPMASCDTGSCVLTPCPAGYANCDSLPETGCETSLLTDGACGACGVTCPSGKHCQIENGNYRCRTPPSTTPSTPPPQSIWNYGPTPSPQKATYSRVGSKIILQSTTIFVHTLPAHICVVARDSRSEYVSLSEQTLQCNNYCPAEICGIVPVIS